MAGSPVLTDPSWIAQFAEPCSPASPPGRSSAWRRELAQFNEELRARFATGSGKGRMQAQRIRRVVAAHFELTQAEIIGASQRARYVKPRQIAMYLCVRFAGLSAPQAGALFGNRDHATVLHAVRRVERRMAAEPALARTIDALVAACRELAQQHPTTTP